MDHFIRTWLNQASTDILDLFLSRSKMFLGSCPAPPYIFSSPRPVRSVEYTIYNKNAYGIKSYWVEVMFHFKKALLYPLNSHAVSMNYDIYVSITLKNSKDL